MADVTYLHHGYVKASDFWLMTERAATGYEIDKYIPTLNKSDNSAQNKDRNDAYKERAVYYNATGRTITGLIGTAYRRQPLLEVGASLEYVEENIDGQGLGIDQQSMKATKEILKKGRSGLLVDYPATDRQTTLADQESGYIRPSCVLIEAQNITNWALEKKGASMLLSLVVIKETYVIPSDDFGGEVKTQYRVLKLEEGRYIVEIWRQGLTSWAIYEQYEPRLSSGAALDYIPFAFIGAEDNDSNIGSIPALDLSRLNIAHYRNSADYEDTAFFSGQVQPYITGLTETWRDHLESEGIYIGSRAPLLLPEGGSFGMSQAQPNIIPREAMSHKEQQMASLGASLIEMGGAVKTATQAAMENQIQHSVLSLVVTNVSDAYTKALEWMGAFTGDTTEPSYEINKDFMEARLDPQMLTALIQAWQSGRYPSSDLWAKLKEGGVISPDRDDEDIKLELESEPSGLALDGVIDGTI